MRSAPADRRDRLCRAARACGPRGNQRTGRIILRNSQHLLSLINDILDMSKVESGKLVLESVAFSPEEALHAVSALMRTSAAQRGIAY
jgi:signal transduction histidine kinase